MLRGRNIKSLLRRAPLSHTDILRIIIVYSELYNTPQVTNRTLEVLRICGLWVSGCGLSDQILVIYSFKVYVHICTRFSNCTYITNPL